MLIFGFMLASFRARMLSRFALRVQVFFSTAYHIPGKCSVHKCCISVSTFLCVYVRAILSKIWRFDNFKLAHNRSAVLGDTMFCTDQRYILFTYMFAQKVIAWDKTFKQMCSGLASLSATIHWIWKCCPAWSTENTTAQASTSLKLISSSGSLCNRDEEFDTNPIIIKSIHWLPVELINW